MNVTFRFILYKVTKSHDLFIILYTDVNKLCSETLDVVASTLFV